MATWIVRLALWLAALAPGAALSQPAPIVVGAVVSQTGAHADLADPYRKALLLWQEQTNAGGGLLGRPVELRILDDRSEATRVAALYSDLIRQGAEALIGPYGTAATMAAYPEAESAKRVMIAGAAWSRSVQKRTPRYLFQACAPYVSYGTGVLALAKEQGYKRVVVLARDEVAAREMAVGAIEAATKLGLLAGDVIVYPGDTADFAPLVSKIAAGLPEAWIAFGELRDAAEMVKALKKLGYAPRLFFARSASDPRLMDLLGQDAERSLGAAEYLTRLPTSGNAAFVEAYTAKWKAAPGATAAEGYAAATVLSEGIKRAGSTKPGALREALASLVTQTVLGEYRVNAAGEQVGIVAAVTQVQDGRIQPVWPQWLATGKLLPYPQWADREYK